MKRVILAVFSAGLMMSAAAAVAQDDAIETRQQIMEDIGKATGQGGKMAKGEMPYDQATAQEMFATIHAKIQEFPEHFPEGTETGGDTRAKETIWTDREKFEDQSAQLEQIAARYAEATPADLDSFKPAFGEMTKTCSSCHETFRLPKD